MVDTLDITTLARVFPQPRWRSPDYAIVGGTGVACILGSSRPRRIHQDIDLFAFRESFIRKIPGYMTQQSAVRIGRINGERFRHEPGVGIPIEIVRGAYFDSEITPSTRDVRKVRCRGMSVRVVSPEFLLVSKLSYPNVHRSHDFQDVLALAQNVDLDEGEIGILISRTSIRSAVTPADVVASRDSKRLTELLRSIHGSAIRRFLYSEWIKVESLNINQVFVLLDLRCAEPGNPSPLIRQAVSSVLALVNYTDRILEIARIGLTLLMLGLSKFISSTLIECPSIRSAMLRTLPSSGGISPTAWLSSAKIIYCICQELEQLESASAAQFDWLRTSELWSQIIDATMLEKGGSRYFVLTMLRCLRSDFANQVMLYRSPERVLKLWMVSFLEVSRHGAV